METLTYAQIPSPTPAGFASTVFSKGHSIVGTPKYWEVSSASAVLAIYSSYVGSSDELAWAKFNGAGAGKLDQLATLYAGKYAAGFDYTVPGDPSGSHNYQIDRESLQNVAGAGSWAMACLTLTTESAPISAWPDGFFWIDSNNVGVPMTAPQCAQFATAVAHYVASLIICNRILKNAILAASNMKALDAVDINAGWPING